MINDPLGWFDNGTNYRSRFENVLSACKTLHSSSIHKTHSVCRDNGEIFYDKMVADPTGLGPVGTHKLLLNLAVAQVIPADCCAVRRIGGEGCRRYVQWQFFDPKNEKADELTDQDKTKLDNLNVDLSYFQLHHALIDAGVFRRDAPPMFTEHLCCERSRLHNFWYYEPSKKGGWIGKKSSAKSVHDLLYLSRASRLGIIREDTDR